MKKKCFLQILLFFYHRNFEEFVSVLESNFDTNLTRIILTRIGVVVIIHGLNGVAVVIVIIIVGG